MGFDAVKKIRVGDLEVAFREAGRGDPIVLLHGWPLSSITWRKVIPGLSPSARCIAPDLLGAGQTQGDPGRDHGIAAQRDLIVGLLDALDLDRVTLLGHDSGGTTAREVACAHPERVARLVIADTEVPGHIPDLVPTVSRLMRMTNRLVLFGWIARSKRFARSKAGVGRIFSNVKLFDFDEFYHLMIEPLARSEAVHRGTLRFAQDFDFGEVDRLRESYGALTMPKLLLWGEDDRIFPLEQGWRLRDMLPPPVRFDLIPGAGMLIHEERPGAWVGALGSFLKETSAAG